MVRAQRPSFIRDESANLGTTLGIVVLIVLPLGLFVLLLRYLRQASPAGSAATSVETLKEPRPVEAVSGPASRVPGARKCPRCGVAVKPHRGGGGTECPNCGAGLG